MLEMVYNPTTTIVLKSIDLQHNLVISYMKLVIEFMDVDGLEHLWVEHNSWICVVARTCGLADLSLDDGSHAMDDFFQLL